MKKVLSLILTLALLLNVSAFSVGAETVTGDVFDVISDGIATSENLLQGELSKLHNDGGVGYGFEWYIIALLRAGKNIDENILNEYYQSVSDKAVTWTDETKPTDIERTALALAVMKKNIADVGGKDLAALIFNSPKLSDGPNELAYALLALDASGVEISGNAVWSRTDIISELLSFQNADGSFAPVKNGSGDVDITAMCLQALAPYRGETGVAQAIDDGVAFLKGKLSDEFAVSDNVNSTAQVLLSLATLGIDATDTENGFGDSDKNIISALVQFKNPNGSGYVYGENVSAMATVQVMQAYDAYRKAFKEGISYWDFKTEGAKYDDTTSDEDSGDESGGKAEDAIVYVTIASDGDIVAGKDGKSVAQVPVTVSDKDEDGHLTVDEVLYATHEVHYEGGAEQGYVSAETTFGLSIITLWGHGDFENPTSAGYWKNDASCWSLKDEVKEGDFITAFNYYDVQGWSDAYSYFSNREVSVEAGERASLELKYSGYDEFWNPVSFACAGAKIKFVNCENAPVGEFVTDEEGKVSIAFSEDAQAGEYFAVAYKDDKSIVPSVCRITVTSANQGGGAGGNSTDKITAYIKVYDPKGQTYLQKKSFSVEKGTNAYELLCKTGLKIETENTAYGIYIKSIEGLGEFDAGQKSGWMYSVNGEFPDLSLDSYKLASGDFVELIYTRAYGTDIGGPALKAEKTPEKEIEQDEEKDEEPVTEGINGFADVSESDWYYDSVNFVSENNLMKGTDKGFEPQSKMTRAMLVTVLWRLENEPKAEKTHKFYDVKTGEWYSDALNWAYSEKIVSGISDTLFGTNSDITREQLVTILYRYAKKNGEVIESKNSLSAYKDSSEVSAYATEAMSWAISAGIINGVTKETLAPKNTATRAEVATILMRFCEGPKDETVTGGEVSLSSAVLQTANYLTENVKNPQISSIGGEWSVIGLARSGITVPSDYFDTYYSNVEEFVRLKDGVLHSKKYTEYSRVVIALSAIGKNAESVAGYNLVAPICDYEKTVWQGINGAVWALIALDSGDYGTEEIRKEYISHIMEREKKDGGWSLSDDEKNPDADITAMVLLALSNYREREDVKAAIERGVKVLSELQNDDGGYISDGKRNSETAAQVLTAISTLGISYEDLRFVKNGKSLLDNVISFRLPDGSFMHTDESNMMATEQCFYALVAAERSEKQKTPIFDMSA